MSPITCRPVYDCRCLGQWWGIYAGSTLTALTRRYPSKLMRDLRK